MTSTNISITLFFLLPILFFGQEKSEYKIHTIAFYNLENLFHPEDDPITFDNDRTPNGKDHWTYEIYNHKLSNMGKAISDIGKELTNNTPAIVGLAEIENRKVLEGLINTPTLRLKNYGIVHFNSPDRRGIDVALLYQKSMFKPKNTSAHQLLIYDTNANKRIHTRDQLLVSGYLDGDLIHIIVNHWPSRRGGEAKSQYKRIKAAALNKKITDSLFAINPYAKIVIMGDLNDNPNNQSVRKTLGAKHHKKDVNIKELYNPMYNMAKKGIGSLAWGDRWSLFDQIIVSANLLQNDYTTYRYYKAGIFNPEYLITSRGKYKGYPFRSFANGSYTGGYSDHFPVYIHLIKEKR
ncbi:endonuclease/exonuclease/phosphatase family protein [Aquimarina sediminis]|uniref:endonuclease/exonuclease/phosphatase family protein n=1 Tax=Aquimarina sediminis TaxID=2070536 RepID=UPI000CA02D56|nr:endonuclease/exonuclease/phosphatase family protein [Aquimarina sediminis]